MSSLQQICTSICVLYFHQIIQTSTPSTYPSYNLGTLVYPDLTTLINKFFKVVAFHYIFYKIMKIAGKDRYSRFKKFMGKMKKLLFEQNHAFKIFCFQWKNITGTYLFKVFFFLSLVCNMLHAEFIIVVCFEMEGWFYAILEMPNNNEK